MKPVWLSLSQLQQAPEIGVPRTTATRSILYRRYFPGIRGPIARCCQYLYPVLLQKNAWLEQSRVSCVRCELRCAAFWSYGAGAPSTDCSKSRVLRRRVPDGMRPSRYHEYKRYFICLKAVAALGFESSFKLARLSCLLRLRRVVGNPDFGRKQLIAREARGDPQLIEILHPRPKLGERHLRARENAGVPHCGPDRFSTAAVHRRRSRLRPETAYPDMLRQSKAILC